jgi:hypothetical protein
MAQLGWTNCDLPQKSAMLVAFQLQYLTLGKTDLDMNE